MATGASTADLAVVLVDARKGLLTQTRRHRYIDANIVGFLHILEGCRQNEIEHLVYASSSSVYGANTRMATGASTADLAVLLVDARKGLLTQTHRHSYIVSLLGIRHVVLAVNKMDLVDWDRATFDAIAADYRAFAERIGLANVITIPVSALTGDNVTQPGSQMPWYSGPTLLDFLESVEVESDRENKPFRMRAPMT